MRSLRLLLPLLVALAIPASATTLAVTDFPSSGTLTASALNARFAQVEGVVNGKIGDANLSTSDPISLSKILNDHARYCVTETLACATTTANAFVTRPPATGYVTSAFVACHGCSSSDIDVTVQVDTSTVTSFTGIANTTTQSSTGLSSACSTSTDVNVDIVVTTAGSCTGLDTTICFAMPHAAY